MSNYSFATVQKQNRRAYKDAASPEERSELRFTRPTQSARVQRRLARKGK